MIYSHSSFHDTSFLSLPFFPTCLGSLLDDDFGGWKDSLGDRSGPFAPDHRSLDFSGAKRTTFEEHQICWSGSRIYLPIQKRIKKGIIIIIYDDILKICNYLTKKWLTNMKHMVFQQRMTTGQCFGAGRWPKWNLPLAVCSVSGLVFFPELPTNLVLGKCGPCMSINVLFIVWPCWPCSINMNVKLQLCCMLRNNFDHNMLRKFDLSIRWGGRCGADGLNGLARNQGAVGLVGKLRRPLCTILVHTKKHGFSCMFFKASCSNLK